MAHAQPPVKASVDIPVTPVLLSARGEKLIRTVSTIAVLLVFGSALILSWNGLTHLAAQAGFSPSYAWLMPLAIDGMVVAGGLNVLHSSLTRQSTKFGWFLTILGAAVSIWGNMTAFGEEGILNTQAIVHGIAPISMALSLEALLRILRGRIHATQTEIDKMEEARIAEEAEAAKRREAEERKRQREERAAARKSTSTTAKKRTAPAKKAAAQQSQTRESATTEPPTASHAQQESQKPVSEQTTANQGSVARPDALSPTEGRTETRANGSRAAVAEALEVDPLDFDNPLATMMFIVEELPEGTSDTDKVLALLEEGIEKPSSKDIALVLGKEDDEVGKRSAYKALERARNKQKKLAEV